MKRILVPCDGSPSALRAVRHVATEAAAGAAASAEIELLHVIAPMTAVTLAEAFSAHSLDDRFPPQAAQALEPAAALLAGAGLRYTLHCRFGDPAAEIAALARASGCGAIVMGTRGHGALASLVIGSVATRVVHLVEVPVTLVK